MSAAITQERRHAPVAASLSEQIESACAMAACLYAQGADTTAIDAEVDRLMALFEAGRQS